MRNKKWLPYLGLPILLTALILLKWGHLDGSVLLFRCALVVFGYLAALGDIREKRVPNRLVAAMLGAWVLLLTPQLFFRTQQAIDWALNGGLGLLLGGAVFLTVYLISRKGLGGGDVKLMAVSGLYLGPGRSAARHAVRFRLGGCGRLAADSGEKNYSKGCDPPWSRFCILGCC